MDKALDTARNDLMKCLAAIDIGYEDRSMLVAYLEAFIEEVVRAASTRTDR